MTQYNTLNVLYSGIAHFEIEVIQRKCYEIKKKLIYLKNLKFIFKENAIKF